MLYWGYDWGLMLFFCLGFCVWYMKYDSFFMGVSLVNICFSGNEKRLIDCIVYWLLFVVFVVVMDNIVLCNWFVDVFFVW